MKVKRKSPLSFFFFASLCGNNNFFTSYNFKEEQENIKGVPIDFSFKLKIKQNQIR